MVNSNSRRALFIIVLVIIASAFAGAVFAQRPGSAANSDAEIRDSLKTFSQVYDVVEQNYADKVDPDKAIYNGAIPAMLHVLDPHSNFFDPKQYAQLREDQRGKYYGVGMQVGPRNNKVIVIAPFAGTPAYKAGIRPGDVIIAVDGKPTDNMTTSDVQISHVAGGHGVSRLAIDGDCHIQDAVRTGAVLNALLWRRI